MQHQAIVNLATPAWKNAPEKSPFTNAWVLFRKPSVLSELDKSALAQIIFSTCCANTLNTAAPALRVASSAFCCTLLQSTTGAEPLNHSSSFAALSGFAA